jgi:phosphatidylglycerophosphatase A
MRKKDELLGVFVSNVVKFEIQNFSFGFCFFNKNNKKFIESFQRVVIFENLP